MQGTSRVLVEQLVFLKPRIRQWENKERLFLIFPYKLYLESYLCLDTGQWK